eukprot:m.53248 g.53248  ORF g.53248 m.53248 type:complete len:180 (+) comp12776_c0_seq1:182-721(+)
MFETVCRYQHTRPQLSCVQPTSQMYDEWQAKKVPNDLLVGLYIHILWQASVGQKSEPATIMQGRQDQSHPETRCRNSHARSCLSLWTSDLPSIAQLSGQGPLPVCCWPVRMGTTAHERAPPRCALACSTCWAASNGGILVPAVISVALTGDRRLASFFNVFILTASPGPENEKATSTQG